MPAADLFIRQGDTIPVFTDTILDQGGAPLSPESVTFRMRSLESGQPVTLAGTASIVGGASVQYEWAASDTAVPGFYQAEWGCTLTGGGTYTFPNDGYRTIEIEPTIAGTPQTLVSIPDCKDVLNIASSDTSHDQKILRFLQGVQPIVENLVGPVIPQQYEEWHRGGHVFIMLRKRPSGAPGTSPFINLIACSEYLGPIEWPLAIIQSPDLGQLYSCELNMRLAQVTRRTAGGGTQPFPLNGGNQDVHVIYECGQTSVPANVYEGTLEIVREFYQQTQQSGPAGWGRDAVPNDDAPISPPIGFLISGRVREWLGANKRHPGVG